ncbi:hypothetical protein HNP84_000534 [Thermocatellispora tengchongensis]|uniref:Uncharacterized protein n=1 Tax=Thermocatellispora tengchongensis TaxID=1073253 RepID=A0A840NXB1_9ACTN|nr:hypothetical protein [Thermocatellispora tengchongensis]MBB5130846.1 hypothetical protein [Thermocatellispora tengchongensis]
MDVEAEVADLKLRMNSLEAAGLGGFETGGPPADLLAEIRDRMHGMQLGMAALSLGLAEVRADVAQVRAEMKDESEAVTVEIAGVRWQLREQSAATRAEIQATLDALLREVGGLSRRIDRLLKSDSA